MGTHTNSYSHVYTDYCRRLSPISLLKRTRRSSPGSKSCWHFWGGSNRCSRRSLEVRTARQREFLPRRLSGTAPHWTMSSSSCVLAPQPRLRRMRPMQQLMRRTVRFLMTSNDIPRVARSTTICDATMRPIRRCLSVTFFSPQNRDRTFFTQTRLFRILCMILYHIPFKNAETAV